MWPFLNWEKAPDTPTFSFPCRMGEQKAPAVGSSLSKAETHWQRKPVLTTSCGRGGSLLSLQKLYDHTQWPSQTLAALPVVIIPWELIRFLTQERGHQYQGERESGIHATLEATCSFQAVPWVSQLGMDKVIRAQQHLS